MRVSRFPIPTLKETPADAEIVSHQLMLRAGMIRKLASGLYSWLPLGVRVLRNVERVVRQEMERIDAAEVFLPAVQPAELWQESQRWEQYGPELLRFKDRHERDFCFGPTHEEVITDLVRGEIKSYRQLPVTYYQIQTKFRDEIRPRFGIMRAREFIMKDAYSFHTNPASLQETYDRMYQAYVAVFTRLGLGFRAVLADSGSIGGHTSHEFHVLADSGEDAIAFSDSSDYAANVELAEAAAPVEPRPAPTESINTVDTPGQHTMEALASFMGVPTSRCLKTLLVKGEAGGLIALCLRGDHHLNEIKAEKLSGVLSPLTLAEDADIRAATGAGVGSIGPVGLEVPVIADRAAAVLADFVCGANQDDRHLSGVNWGRDLAEPQVEDLRNVVEGDPSPDGDGHIAIRRGIEVGHIFQLGTKYSEAMEATVLDEDGKSCLVTMGCYGIGVTRIIAAAIEQNHDDRGIAWPAAMAPFQVAVLPLNAARSERVRQAAESVYAALSAAGIDTLIDDRGLRPGVMFADMELIGIPHRLVVGERGLDQGMFEYKGRQDAEPTLVPQSDIIDFLQQRIAH